ncbi:MAG: TerB family tellurite resistance protein, partial [Giesbergeria sp.]|nr:TerB family tellurite resistance protein [Giesbergeria sp.]
EDPAHAVQLAAAVLLVEVVRADASTSPAEQQALLAALQRKFRLAPDEQDRLLELATTTAHTAYDYHRFTGTLNDHFTHDQKILLVEAMWQVAYADGHLDAHENHAINKVAGLLHVTHGEYIAAKLRAKEAAQFP